MELKEGTSVILDTNCFIYYFEDHEEYASKLELLFSMIQDGKIRACMSVLSFLELLVKPKQQGNVFLENRYKLLLTNYPNLKIADISLLIADKAASLRAAHGVKTPDAIILATAIVEKSDYFITNDLRLIKVGNHERINSIIIGDL